MCGMYDLLELVMNIYILIGLLLPKPQKIYSSLKSHATEIFLLHLFYQTYINYLPGRRYNII